VTTTRRGWWPAIEPALLAFALIVCGSVSLPEHSRASAFDSGHPCDASRSSRWTAIAPALDCSDDGDDDDDDVVDALVAAPIVPTSDDALAEAVVQAEFDVLRSLRAQRLPSRGPPDRPLQSWSTADANSSDDNLDDDDDDDDDDGSSDLGSAPQISDSGQTRIPTRLEFDALISLTPDNHSLRAPPQ